MGNAVSLKAWADKTNEYYYNMIKEEEENDTDTFKNAKALMCALVGKDLNPFNLVDIRKFNKVIEKATTGLTYKDLGNEKGEGTSITDEGVKAMSYAVNYKKKGKPSKLAFTFKITKTESTDLNENNIKYNVKWDIPTSNSLKTLIEDSNVEGNKVKIKFSICQYKDKASKGKGKASKGKDKTSRGEATLTLNMQTNEVALSSASLKVSYSSFVGTDIINIVIVDSSQVEELEISYLTYKKGSKETQLFDAIQAFKKKEEERMKTRSEFVMESINFLSEKLTTLNNELIPQNKITIVFKQESFISKWWNKGGGQDFLRKQLESCNFNKKYIDKFIEYFGKEIVTNGDDRYGILSGYYNTQFTGDIGELETKVRLLCFEEYKKEKSKITLNTNLDIRITGLDTSITGKQLPADGKISFKYNDKDYVCTFQSKFYNLGTLQRGLYSGTSFYLGYISQEQFDTSTYAYPKEDIENYPLYEHEDLLSGESYLKYENYLGAIPGLLRIKSHIELRKETEKALATCDFYYISGMYIPSVYIIKKITDLMKEPNKVIPLEITGLKNSWNGDKHKFTSSPNNSGFNAVKGSLQTPPTTRILENIMNFN